MSLRQIQKEIYSELEAAQEFIQKVQQLRKELSQLLSKKIYWDETLTRALLKLDGVLAETGQSDASQIRAERKEWIQFIQSLQKQLDQF